MTAKKIKRLNTLVRQGVVRWCNLIYFFSKQQVELFYLSLLKILVITLFIWIYKFYKWLDQMSHIAKFILLTKTELFDRVWTPLRVFIEIKTLLLPAETKFEQITQNGNIDDWQFPLTSHDLTINTDIQDADLLYLAARIQQSCIAQMLMNSALPKQFLFQWELRFQAQKYHTLSNTNCKDTNLIFLLLEWIKIKVVQFDVESSKILQFQCKSFSINTAISLLFSNEIYAGTFSYFPNLRDSEVMQYFIFM
ncbi:Hypothetical_protein [Hexamita inflata]|uniref:Hypothetical_protein n=1 Tax=Hexamita inflata TaxID=28002 RepID=A0AA86QG37_9EUKA|nr:Hypothetical protein HINF_LOCUS38695 [Hexamita inflata]